MNIFPRLTRLSARQLAGLSLLCNLPFALVHTHRGAFDTYIHIFLADHYRRTWFDLWEPRWYMGFSMASYPPLVHQLIALVSVPVEALMRWFSHGTEPYPGAWRWQAEEAAYVLVLLAVLALFPLAVRALARCFVGPRAATLAALLTVFLPGLSLVLWSFGQLPSAAATAIILVAMARAHAFLLRGQVRHLLQAVALAALAAASHHGVFLLVPFAGAAVVGQAALRLRAQGARRGGAGGRRGEPALGSGGAGEIGDWRLVGAAAPSGHSHQRAHQTSVVHRPSSVVAPWASHSWLTLLFRLTAWVLPSGLLVAAVLWPMLAWGRGQSLQVPINHLSRHNLLQDFRATIFFFWPVYGPLLLVWPWTVWAAVRVRGRRLLAPAALALVLFVMGLGGTTPLPRLLYGAGWEWLTYERFAFWAALVLVPLAAAALLLIARREPLVAGLFLGAMAIASVLGASLSIISKSQPPVVDMAPIVRFLDAPEHRPFRYFTLGFGDQLAQLSGLTTNGTPDGTYHTARGLPELRSSGLGSIDMVMWSHGAWEAAPFLAQAERYGARWAFVNHARYPPVLLATGWQYRFDIGTVQAWEKPSVQPVPVTPPPGLNRSPAALWWGLCPLVVLALAGLILAVDLPWRAWRAGWTRPAWLRALRALRLGGWAVTIALLTLWWYHGVYHGSTPWVYVVYQSVMVFACDVAAAATLALWAVERALRGAPLRLGPRSVLLGGVGLILACAFSLRDSVDRPLTVALLAHLLLLGGWYLMLINDPPAPRLAGLVLAGVMGIQAFLALAQAATQTTAWLSVLGLPWPGAQYPASSGVSVVQTDGGARWLRAYGTLGHPNILGGYLVIGLGAAVERFAATRARGWLVAAWLMVAGLLLTFSRSAWLAAVVMIGLAFWLMRWGHAGGHADWPRVRRWAAASLGALTLLSLPMLPLLIGRLSFGEDASRLEQRSLDDRQRLNQAAVEMLWDRPVAGVGAGTFVVRLYQVAGEALPLEPAHNLPLLLAAELGMPGLAALGALLAAVAWRLWGRRHAHAGSACPAAEPVLGAVLVGLLVIGLFDHYWWTMPPARLALATVLSLWVGWGEAGEDVPSRWNNPARSGGARPATQSAAPPPG